MSQKLYEEALADAKKVTEVAENNAKNAILEAVLPRIRSLIERELLTEDAVEDDMLLDDPMHPMTSDDPTGAPDVVVAPDVDVAVADAITPPDEEGKMTLDLDALGTEVDDGSVEPPMFGANDSDEYELSMESADTLKVIRANTIKNHSDLISRFKMTAQAAKKLAVAGRLVRESAEYRTQITRMISRVENMYEYVQESVSDPDKKETYSSKLEKLFQDLKKLQETAMSKTKKNRLYEEDETQMDLDVDAGGDEGADADGELTLKLTGLPDDVELDDVGVDLVAGDDDMGGEDDLDVDMGDDEGGDDMGDLDLGGDDQGSQLESVLRLSDDTVVEIDEGMLRREIARMAKLQEDVGGPPEETDANGHGTPANVLDDFGGADEEGEPILDVDVEADPTAEPLGEMDEEDEAPMDEMDYMETDMPMESAKKKLAFEARLQKRAKAQAAKLKAEARKSSGKRLTAVKAAYNKVAKRFNESLVRSKKLQKQLAESASKGMRSNSAPKRSGGNDLQLRKKLAESNLNNVKLAYANKVLQSESLTRRQKAQVIKRLDDCVTPREAKLVYESVAPAKASRPGSLSEGANRGSGSRATRSGGSSQTLNEGFETDRWAKLAGITK